ncbi:MAG: hypothetical protein O6922_08565 [Chloroflexi bacterium]|nr:hypothetical protein [Chloroflexota bacterium]
MARQNKNRLQLNALGLVVLALIFASCSADAVDHVAAVCDEVLAIDNDVLNERLSADQLVDRLDHLEFELLPEAQGEVEVAAGRFVWAAREIAVASRYDYPTFQVLNYLDTYEQMALHVHAFEAVNEVRRTCEATEQKWVGVAASESSAESGGAPSVALAPISEADAADARDTVVAYLSEKAWGFFGATCDLWVEIDYEFAPVLSGDSPDGATVVVFSRRPDRELGPPTLTFQVNPSGAIAGENKLERSGIAEGCDQW